MKTLRITFLSFFACCLLFTACQQDESLHDVVVEPTELELAESYLIQERSLILFAALKVDYDRYEVTGYIVDKFATIREVNMQGNTIKDFGRDIISDEVLRKLYAHSTEIEDLSKLDVADMARAAKSLVEDDLATEDVDVLSSRLYLAFEFDSQIQSTADCVSASGLLYAQQLIDAQGRFSGSNSHALGTDILTWLQGLEATYDKD